MIDPTNTGDLHGCVAEALHTAHEHHGGLEHAPTANDNAPQTAPKHLIRHAALVGMVHGSQSAHNRLEHLKNNIHYGDAIARQRIEAWLERAKAPHNDNSHESPWGQSIGY